MSGLDLKKLRELQSDLREKARIEMTENITDNLINFVLDEAIIDSFRNEKGRKITQQSKRVIGHWVKEGVIIGEQNNEGGWYYFDRIESIWIDIVTQLREFGLSLGKIKKIREQLFTEVQKGFRLIDFVLMHSVLRSPYIMLVKMDGTIDTTTSELYSEIIQKEVLPPHIAFNFFHLAKEIFPNNHFELFQENINFDKLSPNETKLLFYLRTGDYKEMKIKMEDGAMYLLEATSHEVNDRIKDIINKASYQDISIKKANNKIVYIERVEKIKL